jgi:hypothetical protein
MKTTKFITAIAAAVALFFSFTGNAQSWNFPPTPWSTTYQFIGTSGTTSSDILKFNSYNDMIFYTGGSGNLVSATERMRILGSGTNAGFVGIGTNGVPPTALLELKSGAPTLKLTSTNTLPNSSPSCNINFSTGATIAQSVFPSYGSGQFHLSPGGSPNIGIHMSSGGINFSNSTTYGYGVPVAAATFQFDGSLSSSSVLISDNNYPVLTLPSGFSLGVKGKSYFGNNVGIGTSAANAPLQFANTTVNRKVVLYDTYNDDNQFYGFGVNNSTLRYQVDAITASHVFYAGTSAGTNELMRIKGNGQVGIGVAPVNKLDISGGTVIGSSYAGINIAPTDGLLVQGNVGIGNNFSSTILPYASFQQWNQWTWPLSMGFLTLRITALQVGQQITWALMQA